MYELSAEHFDFVVIFNLDKNSPGFWEYMQLYILIVKQKKKLEVRLNNHVSNGQQSRSDRRCKGWHSSVRNYCTSRQQAHQGRALITLTKVMPS